MVRLSCLMIAILIAPGISPGRANETTLDCRMPDVDVIFHGFAGERISPPPDPMLCRGWPVYLATPSGGFPYTPTLHDADGDGAEEIFLTGGHTFALRGDGTFVPGWPTTEMVYMGYGTNGNRPGPSVADLDGDDDTEILWSTRDWWAGSARLWCFNGKNFDGTDLPGFPQMAIDEPSNAIDVPFVLGDTDGDGDLEAWGPHTLGNTGIHYRLSAFDHLGTRLFTVDLDPAENILSLYFGDLDGDRAPEMFAVSWLEPTVWLHVFEPDGSEAVGYPIALHTMTSGYLTFGPPVPADLDDDGDLEILFGLWGGGTSRAYAYHHDGSACAGFPLDIATSSQLLYIGLGDVTGDGVPELIAFDNHLGGNYRAQVHDLATGALLPGWPYGLTYWPKGFPTVVDVDDDGRQDICLVTGGGELFALSGNGVLLDGYPKAMVSPSISGVGAGDIDGDGYFELVAATWDGWVYAWDTEGPALPGRADWRMRGVNARNTGVFGDSGSQAGVRVDAAAHPACLRVTPNPVREQAFLRLDTDAGPARLEIFDPNGRLAYARGVAGGHAWAWHPRPSDPVGIYWARWHNGHATKSLRIVVTR